jgi:Putative peptidoglycan binding domain
MRAPRTKIALSLAAVSLAAVAVAGPLTGASGQAPVPEPTPNAEGSPLAGDGMWIWYVSKAQRGRVGKIAGRAKKRGIEVVLIKSGDGTKYWGQFSSSLVRALHARGIKVCAWQFVYGRSPSREAAVAAAAVARGADCFVIDAEGHYEGRYSQASTYIRTLRSRVGPDYPIALAAFPYVDYHPAFPFSVFLGPGGAQYNAPQLYWKTIGHSVDTAFVHTYVFNRAYDRPILPLGQVYLNPAAKQIRRFRALAASHGMAGVSWWSWQHAGKKQWKAVGGRTGPIPGYAPYNSFPFLRQGSKGDLVAWAQQLLAGGGFSTPISGYFESPTRTAVLALQTSRGIAQTGNIDVPTWNVLLEFEPLPVIWTKSGAYPAKRRGATVLPEPRSAKLPAKRYEIPPPRDRRPR